MILEIPLKSEGEVLEVDTTELMNLDTAETIMNILTTEQSKTSLFLEFAFEFYKRGFIDTFVQTLQASIDIAIKTNDRDQVKYLLLSLNTLVAYYLNKARFVKSSKSKEKEELLTKATQLLNQADHCAGNTFDSFTLIQKGNLQILKGDIDQAAYQFNVVLKADPNHLAALLSQASFYSAKGDIKNALSNYQNILKLAPDMKPDVRVNIGACFYKLGMLIECEYSLERALEINPSNIDALVLLSIIHWNASKICIPKEKDYLIQKSNSRLKNACDIDLRHPLVCLLLSERYFERQQYAKASKLSKYAISHSYSNNSMAEALSIEAKINQKEGKTDKALSLFERAVELVPDSLFVQTGLGQLYAAKGESDKSVKALQAVLSKEPNNFECLKKLAVIYSLTPETKPKAVEIFDKINKILFEKSRAAKVKNPSLLSAPSTIPDCIEKYRDDPELIVEYGKIHESSDLDKTLNAYLNAKGILEETGKKELLSELLNNIAVLYHLKNDLTNAHSYYQKALNLTKLGDVVSERAEATSITILYNMGRLYEEEFKIEKAREMYQKIIDQHPAYADANIRLGAILMEKGDISNAQGYFKDVFVSDPKNSESMLMLASSILSTKNHKDARKTFEKVLHEIDSRDLYALCSVGNINLNFARVDPKNKAMHYKRSFEFFDKALRTDNFNYSAAIGIGICLAENEKLNEAKDIFTQMQVAVSNAASATINLAHVYVEMGRPQAAAELYESVLKKYLENKDAYIYQCISRSYYIIGKSEKNPEAMKKSLLNIQKAARLCPKDLSLFFNIALVKQQLAHVLNEQPSDCRPVHEMRKAVEGLETAKNIFSGLSEQKPFPGMGYDIKYAKERANYCAAVAKQSLKKIHETEVLEREKIARLEMLREDKVRKEEEKAEAERQRLLAIQQEKDRVEEIRRELRLKIAVDNEKSASRVDDDGAERKRKKKGKDAFIEADGEGEFGVSLKKKRKLTNKQIRDYSEDEVESRARSASREKQVSASAAPRKVRIEDSDEDEEEIRQSKNSKNFLSSAVIESDDDE